MGLEEGEVEGVALVQDLRRKCIEMYINHKNVHELEILFSNHLL